MSNQTPLNPDAVRARIDEFLEGAAICGRFDVMEGTDLLIDASKALAVALPKVTSWQEARALPVGWVIIDNQGRLMRAAGRSLDSNSSRNMFKVFDEERFCDDRDVSLPARR